MRTASLLVLGSVFTSVAMIVACSSDSTPTITTKKDAGDVDARRPYPSFRDDIVPIVQSSCALTACHSSKESNLGIFLAYDPAQIYAEFKKTSPTATGQQFIVPGDPAKSYVMVKLENKQDALKSSCMNMTCGTKMPPDDPLPADQVETFRKWIMDGAKDD